jgi:hypothetical protein
MTGDQSTWGALQTSLIAFSTTFGGVNTVLLMSTAAWSKISWPDIWFDVDRLAKRTDNKKGGSLEPPFG